MGHSGTSSPPAACTPATAHAQLIQGNSLPGLHGLQHLPHLSLSPQLALSCAQLGGQIGGGLSPTAPLLLREGNDNTLLLAHLATILVVLISLVFEVREKMLIFQKLAQQQKYQNCGTHRYIPGNRQDQTLL